MRNSTYKYVAHNAIVKLVVSLKEKFRLYNTQSITYLIILVSGEQDSFICHYCIFQKLCIFDSFGTLVFAVFMGVWGKFFSFFSVSFCLLTLIKQKHLISLQAPNLIALHKFYIDYHNNPLLGFWIAPASASLKLHL